MSQELEAATTLILGVPPEFVPSVLVLSIVIGVATTFAMSLPGYYAQDKKIARESGGRLVYGLSYLSSNIVAIVACGVLSLLLIGWYLDATGAVATSGLCLGMAFVTSLVIGLGGSKFLLRLVEAFRDHAKATEARKGSQRSRRAT